MKEKENVVWGTGNVCSQILHGELHKRVKFLIDNDERKMGCELYGKKIIHPSKISKWENMYIIIAIDNYSLVKKQLIHYGLKEQRDFIWYRDWLFPKKIEELLQHAEEFISKIEIQEKYIGYKMLFSDFLAFDKGVCNYVNSWNEKEQEILLFSEAGLVSKQSEEKLHIPIINLPEVLIHNQYLKGNMEQAIEIQLINYVKEKNYLIEAASNLRLGYPDMANNYEYVICYYADRIVRKIIECWKPSQIILWNAFYAFHTIIRNICTDLNVPIIYMEFGNIPGTIIRENMGQMGESWPARFPEKFLEIPIFEEEYGRGQQLIEYLYKSKLNRNVQPYNDLLIHVKKRLKNNRPIVFYAGQNDNAAGLQPYTENSKIYHSPIFECSDEAAIYLAELCQINGWNYIYKPHPMMVNYCNPLLFPNNTIIVDNVDINDLIDMSDVVVTILSTVSYIALIRKKPVVMLGYTQLKNKGCTYEAFQKEIIEQQLSEAITKSLSENMSENFVKHIVQLEKYYTICGGKNN